MNLDWSTILLFDKELMTDFQCAAEDNVTGAELLLAHKADVNVLDDDWWTPLHTACNCDSPEVLQLLLNVRFYYSTVLKFSSWS